MKSLLTKQTGHPWLTSLTLALGLGYGAHAAVPPHLTDAENLVLNLLQSEQSSPNPWPNTYGTPPFINWNGAQSSARTECSTFVTHLWEHTYGWTPAYFNTWMGTNSPDAARYHDVIQQGKGFTRLSFVQQLQPGDILAIVYYPELQSPSGHVMIVQDLPKATNCPPFVSGTYQWTVPVIDSSKTFHGAEDTRYTHPGGIGHGVFRLYSNVDGFIMGYTWSLLGTSTSDYVPQATSTNVPGRHLVVGRLK
jgi:hypothetical protein